MVATSSQVCGSSQVHGRPSLTLRISGSIDGKLHIWDVFPPNSNAPSGSLLPMKSIDGHQGGPSRIVGFNPKSALIVSGGNDLVSSSITLHSLYCAVTGRREVLTSL